MDELKRMATGAGVGFLVAVSFGVGLISMAAYRSGDDGGSSTQVAVADAQVVDVRLGDLFIEPADLTAEPGALTIRVTNDGAAEHNLAIEGIGATAMLAPGQAGEITVPDAAAGSYHMLCEVPGHEGGGMHGTLTVGAGTGGTPPAMSPEEMVAHDAEVTGSFPAQTAGRGGKPLRPEIAEDGAKVFELTAAEIDWEVEPGTIVPAFAYNAQVPGPEIRAALGDRVRVILHNELPQPTTLHFHGMTVPNEMDGVPVINQDAVMPGESFTYEFTVENTGSNMYHSHFNAQEQVPMGLLGAFVVTDGLAADVDTTMILNDGPLGYTINGKGFPATSPVVAARGQTVRIRYMNEGLQIHPMHLHGMPQEVIAIDGHPLAEPYTADTILVAPGQRIDVLVRATEPGVWAYHCHVLTHAEGPDGMFGMVTAFVVE